MSLPGRVVRIRLNPQDCMTCVDVCRSVGLPVESMSFAAVVSSALSSVMEGLRQNKIAPDRDGFEYSQIMAPFKDEPRSDRARKLGITKEMRFTQRPPAPGIALSPMLQRKQVRLTELVAMHNADPMNMSEEDVKEMHNLALELNP